MGKAFSARNPDASTVRKEDWNRLRIRAMGDPIVIVLNGKEVVLVNDAMVRQAGALAFRSTSGSSSKT
jgi:hypothetical protein